MKKTIMVVDDEPHLLNLVKAILKLEGFRVITANNGEEALKKIRKTKPDLILLDMMMPGMTGLETLERIRKDSRSKNIKVVLLTVITSSEIDKRTVKRLKILDHIEKPFDNTTLAKKVKNLVE